MKLKSEIIRKVRIPTDPRTVRPSSGIRGFRDLPTRFRHFLPFLPGALINNHGRVQSKVSVIAGGSRSKSCRIISFLSNCSK